MEPARSPAHDERTILIGYDGSAHADHAIDEAARMFPGANTIVMTAWTSVRDVARAGRAALPEEVIEKATNEIDTVAEAAAKATAQAGADRASAAGLNARAQTACVDGSVAQAVLRAADEHDVTSVVVGSRGRSGFRSALLGSVSNTVVQHSAKPVVVVHAAPAQHAVSEGAAPEAPPPVQPGGPSASSRRAARARSQAPRPNP